MEDNFRSLSIYCTKIIYQGEYNDSTCNVANHIQACFKFRIAKVTPADEQGPYSRLKMFLDVSFTCMCCQYDNCILYVFLIYFRNVFPKTLSLDQKVH